MQIVRGHPHFEKVNGCPCCSEASEGDASFAFGFRSEPMDMGDLFFLAIDNPDPPIRNIFFPISSANMAAEKLEAIQEVRRAVNAWLYT
jgi:hypothetical protein